MFYAILSLVIGVTMWMQGGLHYFSVIYGFGLWALPYYLMWGKDSPSSFLTCLIFAAYTSFNLNPLIIGGDWGKLVLMLIASFSVSILGRYVILWNRRKSAELH